VSDLRECPSCDATCVTGTRPRHAARRDCYLTERRSQVLGERAPNDGAGGAVFSSSALLERSAELGWNDCGDFRHGSPIG